MLRVVLGSLILQRSADQVANARVTLQRLAFTTLIEIIVDEIVW